MAITAILGTVASSAFVVGISSMGIYIFGSMAFEILKERR